MLFNDRRSINTDPVNDNINLDLIRKTYGSKLPGFTKPGRTIKEWNARAAVISAAKAGSIKSTSKSKKKGK